MLNDEFLDSLQKVNVNLVFYNENVTISIQRDKPIDLIYRSAYDYFKPHGKIKLYYKNKELTPFLNYSIRKYFKKLKNIDILVKDSSRMDNNIDNQFLLNSDFNFGRLNKFNSSNKIGTSKSLEIPNKSNLPQDQRAMTFCWDCKKFPINIFCRDCGAFICKYCRMDFENAHYSHRTITLYPENLAKSANLYKNVLIEDLNEVEKINKNRKKISQKKREINIDIEEKKNQLSLKINQLINKINHIKRYQKEINYYIKNKDKCKEKITKSIKEIESLSDEYTKSTENDSKTNSKDIKEIFSKMNTIEKNTQKICEIGRTIEKWEIINNKLEKALKNAEDRIYTIIEETAEGEELNYNYNNNNNEKNDNNNNNDANINNNNEKLEIKDINNKEDSKLILSDRDKKAGMNINEENKKENKKEEEKIKVNEDKIVNENNEEESEYEEAEEEEDDKGDNKIN